MRKSTFRIVKSIFLIGFLFLFGIFVFLLAKQHETTATHEANLTVDDETNGRVMTGSLKQIGFEYNSSENANSTTI